MMDFDSIAKRFNTENTLGFRKDMRRAMHLIGEILLEDVRTEAANGSRKAQRILDRFLQGN